MRPFYTHQSTNPVVVCVCVCVCVCVLNNQNLFLENRVDSQHLLLSSQCTHKLFGLNIYSIFARKQHYVHQTNALSFYLFRKLG